MTEGRRRMVLVLDVGEPADPSKPMITAESMIARLNTHWPPGRGAVVLDAYWQDEDPSLPESQSAG